MSFVRKGFGFKIEMLNFKMEWTPSGSSVLEHIHSLLTTNLTERKNTLSKNMSDKENKTGKVTKLILLKNNPNWPFHSIASKQLTSCPVNCTLVTSRENLSVFDAVIFNAVGYPMNRPPKKVPGQVWIFFTIESPYYTSDYKFNSTEWRNKINWTMTYRSDSDIWYPYGRISQKEKSSKINFTEVTKTKTKLVAWFVSNCKTPGSREIYVHELNMTLPVDVYGACESKRCPRNDTRRCMEMLSRDYKFYLSFENSLCYDYMTEKVFRYMFSGLVPVVRGGVNYTKFLPPHSFINTADFKSPKHLGEYLLYLHKNHTAYLEYFQWRNYYYLDSRTKPLCELCKRLSNPSEYANLYKNVFSWWHDGTCKPPKDLSSRHRR